MEFLSFKTFIASLSILFLSVLPCFGQGNNVNIQEKKFQYYVGSGIGDFTRLLNGKLPHNVGTYGLVSYDNPIDTTINNQKKGIVNGVHLPLKSRVITIKHPETKNRFIYVLLDLAFPSENIRRGLVQKMQAFDSTFKSSSLMLTATHTHSAPGGHSDYLGYEVATPGHRPDIVETIVENTYKAIIRAIENEKLMKLTFAEREVPLDVPIAYSRRGLPGYNSNPEIKEKIEDINDCHKATDRLWQLIYFEEKGELNSMLNFFGAHPNRMGSDILSSDTRGAASDAAEALLPKDGIAIFAQNAPGDIDSEGWYGRRADHDNKYVLHPAYYKRDEEGKPHYIGGAKRVFVEGEFLKNEAFAAIEQPLSSFGVVGDIDCELIYVDMGDQKVPRGNYPETLDPTDYYKNDYFLLGGLGKFGSAFNRKLRYAHTCPPTIGLGAIARIDDGLTNTVIGLEKFMRYTRLGLSLFKGSDRITYIWEMYRGQGEKTVMLEGNYNSSALGFKLGGKIVDIFAKFDPVVAQLGADKEKGLHKEHTLYPRIVPLQIAIIGNVAILGVSGEPGNIAGQRIERAVYEELKNRGVKRVIVNGYANENTGYIFTPEEYPSQFAPQQCGFVLYGRWTCPAFRHNFQKLAHAMLFKGDKREELLDRTIQPPVFSDEWYKKASFLPFLEDKPEKSSRARGN